jgi:cation diffusion facilitator CzcD-associated flavoprotein CzcO
MIGPKICIVGAGPSGIAAGKSLLEAGLSVSTGERRAENR